MFKIILIFLILISTCAGAGEIALTSGASSSLANVWGEGGNRTTDLAARYLGERFGVRFDHSVHGDDAGNNGLTGDVLFRPVPGVVLGAGVARFQNRLRGVGERTNLHAMGGYEIPRVLGNVGVGVFFDHWSNGRRLFDRHGIHNPPRNVVSIGATLPY